MPLTNTKKREAMPEEISACSTNTKICPPVNTSELRTMAYTVCISLSRSENKSPRKKTSSEKGARTTLTIAERVVRETRGIDD
jgi:hypothetical protein